MLDQYSLFESTDRDSPAGSAPAVTEQLTRLEQQLATHAQLLQENTRALTALTTALGAHSMATGQEPAATTAGDEAADPAPQQASTAPEWSAAAAAGDRLEETAETTAALGPPYETPPPPTGGADPSDGANHSASEDTAVVPPDPQLADYLSEAGVTAAAVVGPGWVQVGHRRYDIPIRHAADVLRVATTLRHASMPQIWVLAETCEQLGLVTYPDDINSPRSERITSTERNLRELCDAQTFLHPAVEAGWSCNGHVEPWTLMKHESSGKLVHLILEPYTWMYDLYGRGVVEIGRAHV